MSCYADLDVSVLDELPPGRTPIRTRLVSKARRDEGVAGVRAAGVLPTSLDPDAALAKLKEGNARFAQSPELCANALDKRRTDLVEGQAPWATILSCADSRVPPELVFGGLSLGELFICRNAGNIADTDVLGTIEYGAAVLGSPLVVVLGHSN